VRRFCEHRHLRLRMENRVESCRDKPMTKADVAQHLSVLAHLVTSHNITAERISNGDDTGFSLATMAASRSKVLSDTEAGRSLSRGLSAGKDCEHITIGATVTASGRAYSPIVVLPGKESEYGELDGGSVQTPQIYLPAGANVHYREPARVDGPIMLSWVNSFVEETGDLRRAG